MYPKPFIFRNYNLLYKEAHHDQDKNYFYGTKDQFHIKIFKLSLYIQFCFHHLD